jgi:hypothetical protein
MKQYYTLIQNFIPSGRSLGEYLDEQGIHYTVGADFSEDLKAFGYIDPNTSPKQLKEIFRVLIDEHELSAIKLSVDGIDIIQNRSGLNLKNKIRGCFSWFMD